MPFLQCPDRVSLGAGMLMAGCSGMLVVQGHSGWILRDARDTGMLRPTVRGGSWHRNTCSQWCGNVISQGKGKGWGSVTQDQQKGVFFQEVSGEELGLQL